MGWSRLPERSYPRSALSDDPESPLLTAASVKASFLYSSRFAGLEPISVTTIAARAAVTVCISDTGHCIALRGSEERLTQFSGGLFGQGHPSVDNELSKKLEQECRLTWG